MRNVRKLIWPVIFAIGLLLNACKHEPKLPPGTPEVCFDRDIMLTINSNCNVPGCHGSSNGELPSLSTYNDLRRLVEPGKPMSSKLYEVITANPGAEKYMPPKPKPPLSKTQIDQISIWILQGADNTTCP